MRVRLIPNSEFYCSIVNLPYANVAHQKAHKEREKGTVFLAAGGERHSGVMMSFRGEVGDLRRGRLYTFELVPTKAVRCCIL